MKAFWVWKRYYVHVDASQCMSKLNDNWKNVFHKSINIIVGWTWKQKKILWQISSNRQSRWELRDKTTKRNLIQDEVTMRTLSILLYILIFDAANAYLLDTQGSGNGAPGPHTPGYISKYITLVHDEAKGTQYFDLWQVPVMPSVCGTKSIFFKKVTSLASDCCKWSQNWYGRSALWNNWSI